MVNLSATPIREPSIDMILIGVKTWRFGERIQRRDALLV